MKTIEVTLVLAKAIRPGLVPKYVPVQRKGNNIYIGKVWTRPEPPKEEKQGWAATHYGECPYCGNRQMLPGGRLADHGYNLHFGFRNGTCPGSREKPFETSKTFTEKIVADAQASIQRHKARIAAGDLVVHESVIDIKGKTINREISRAGIIEDLRGFIGFQKERLEGWKPRELTPVGGRIDKETGLRELNELEKKVMLQAQQNGEAKAEAETWRGASAYVPLDRIRKLARDGFLEIIEDKMEKRKGATLSFKVAIVRAKISERASSKYPALEKPIRGGKMVQAMWEKLKVEGELKTKVGSSQAYFVAEELAQRNSDRVDMVEKNYNDTYVVLRKK